MVTQSVSAALSIGNTQGDAGKVRYQRVRAAFILRGTTLNEWCRANGVHIQNVREAFFGRMRGPVGRALVQRIEAAAQVHCE